MVDRSTPEPVSRRTLAGLAGISAVGLPLLAACGGNSSTATDTGSGGSSSQTPAGPTSSSGGGGSSSHGLAPTSEIPVGGGKIFGDQQVVVTQPTAGEFKGFSSTCTHQGCQVSRIVGQSIVCPCHGSSYSIVDGSVQGGPAPRPLPAVKLSVQGNEISLA